MRPSHHSATVWTSALVAVLYLASAPFVGYAATVILPVNQASIFLVFYMPAQAVADLVAPYNWYQEAVLKWLDGEPGRS